MLFIKSVQDYLFLSELTEKSESPIGSRGAMSQFHFLRYFPLVDVVSCGLSYLLFHYCFTSFPVTFLLLYVSCRFNSGKAHIERPAKGVFFITLLIL